jgi:hypothetical protein
MSRLVSSARKFSTLAIGADDRRECHAGVARRIRLSARSLLQAAQNGGAGLRYAGIDRLAPWHDRPAAFLDVRRLFI